MPRAGLIAAALFCTPAAAQAHNLNGELYGLYHCGQGVTALRLTIIDQADGEGRQEIRARFDFAATPDNPAVPSGSFMMTGARGPAATGQDGPIVFLRGVEWIEQPANYVMVNLYGWYSETAEGEMIGGQVYAQAQPNPARSSPYSARRAPAAD